MELTNKEIQYILKKIIKDRDYSISCDIIVETDDDCGLSDAEKNHVIDVDYDFYYDRVLIKLEGSESCNEIDIFDNAGQSAILKGVLEIVVK